jgi:transcription elongation factor GreB
MSKAFTREDAEVPDVAPRRRGIPVPDPNYVTAAGAAALRAELATAEPDRAREIADHLATAQVQEPPGDGRVGFGSAVTLDDGRTYRIVGAIEADPRAGAISFGSPLARALLGARVGDVVATPRGDVQVVKIG